MSWRWPDLTTYNRTDPARGDSDVLAATAEKRGNLYIKSYMRTRLLIGGFSLPLPYMLVLWDLWFIHDSQVKNSMSAYYHSPARDAFVGALCVVGAMLITYMSARMWSWDFLLSTFAGFAVILVAIFPTRRPCCLPEPRPLTDLQQKYGEESIRTIHGVAATSFGAALAVLCIVFALREFGYGAAAAAMVGKKRGVRKVWTTLKSDGGWRRLFRGSPRIILYAGCAVLIAGGGVWSYFGNETIGEGQFTLHKTYVGEIVAFTAFGAAWLVLSWTEVRSVLKPVIQVVQAIKQGAGGGAVAVPPPPADKVGDATSQLPPAEELPSSDQAVAASSEERQGTNLPVEEQKSQGAEPPSVS